jgi:hypothetical protein
VAQWSPAQRAQAEGALMTRVKAYLQTHARLMLELGTRYHLPADLPVGRAIEAGWLPASAAGAQRAHTTKRSRLGPFPEQVRRSIAFLGCVAAHQAGRARCLGNGLGTNDARADHPYLVGTGLVGGDIAHYRHH